MTFQAFVLGERSWDLALKASPRPPPLVYWKDPAPLVDAVRKSSSCAIDVFREIADWVESSAGTLSTDPSLRGAMALVQLDSDEAFNIETLNPVRTDGGWASVVAMLILAFPEIHWVLLQSPPTGKEWGPIARGAHFATPQLQVSTPIEMHWEGLEALFDPGGLRQCIRENILTLREVGAYVPRRTRAAIVLDDEIAYCYFNAYAAYRLGYRCCILNSARMLERVMKCQENEFDASFEDLYLSFADAHPNTGNVHLSHLNERDEQLPGFRRIPHRVLITVGGKEAKNQLDYLEDRSKMDIALRSTKGCPYYEFTSELVPKPFAGLFHLIQQSKIQRNKEYVWPPTHAPTAKAGHSAPGRLHEIADRLVARARHTLANARDVQTAVYAAILAREAAEYLGLKAPTTSLDAISIMHEAEVVAECSFLGVRRDLDVEGRLNDLDSDLEASGKYYEESKQALSVAAAKLQILESLVKRFRDNNQFEEELFCLAKTRSLRRKITSLSTKPTPSPKQKPLYLRLLDLARGAGVLVVQGVRQYIDLLLVRFSNFFAAVVVWSLAFTTLFWFGIDEKHAGTTSEEVNTLVNAGLHAVVAFFGMGPPHDLLSLYEAIVTGVAILVGALHLGLFISYLYSVAFRR